MTPRYHRFATILIVLSVLQSRVVSFTIHRGQTTLPLEPSAAESHLSVKNDLPTRTSRSQAPQTTASQTAPITQTTDKNELTPVTKRTTTLPQDTSSKASTSKGLSSTNATTLASSTIPTTTTLKTTVSTTSLATSTKQHNVTTGTNTTTTKKEETTTTQRQDLTPGVTTDAEDETSSTQSASDLSNSTNDLTKSNDDIPSKANEKISEKPIKTTSDAAITTNNVSMSNLNNTAGEHTTTEDNIAKNESTVPSKENTVEQKTEVNNASYSTLTVTIGLTTDESSSITDGSSDPTTATAQSSSLISTNEIKPNVTETTETTTSIPETTTKLKGSEKVIEVLTGAGSTDTATPFWKKYTVIDRKRFTTLPGVVASSSTELEDLEKAGTAQSSANLEKALNITSDIPSLVELKNEILALNKINTATEKLKQTQAVSTPSTDTTSLTEIFTTSSAEDVAETTKVNVIISSKRAGFLDYSSRPVQTETTTIEQTVTPVETTRTVSPTKSTSTTLESKPNTEEPQRSSSMASQSQLAEDAINEELMKEEILSDVVDAQRQREDTLVVKAKESTPLPPVEPPVAVDSSVEDKLSVKPISARPQGGLYTVSPNYKPLKKIEVLPPKPFVRNPDDNSWRNESLSSLGIVFKANNSSKPFTQVLKNKTETQWSSLLEKDSKGDEPAELRERLEKIAEQRKSKKKKINQFGETVYTDYEESSSGEKGSTINPKEEPITFAPITAPKEFPTSPSRELEKKKTTTLFDFEAFKTDVQVTTGKSKVIVDDYEPEDEEPDYTLANIDLKKFITPPKPNEVPESRRAFTLTSPPTTRTFLPDRKPTVQYFPPREKQKVVVNDYDTDFQKKVNSFTYKDVPSKVTHENTQEVVTLPTYHFPKNKYDRQRPNDIVRRPDDLNKNIYLTQPASPIPVPVEQIQGYVVNPDGTYNRATYVIKHLRDFIDDVVKADENPNYAITDAPIQTLTTNVAIKETVKPPPDYYDYEAQFRKDVINRFVENFNQNSDRFKADFPILYNTSVVHHKDGGREASSTAFMKRLYEDARAIQHAGKVPRKFDPNCDRTVELSPAYELHYYVPEEEEKEEFQPRAVSSAPYSFRL